MSFKYPLSTFNSDGSYFAIITSDNHINIWDSATGKVIQTYTDSDQLQVSYTCILWVTPNVEKSVKKRKRGSSNDTLGQLLVGTSAGEVHLWDLGTGTITKKYGGDQNIKDPISSICINKNNTEIYFTSKTTIYDYHMNGDFLSKYSMGKHTSNFILINEDETMFYTASSSIICWSIGSKEIKKINRVSTLDKEIIFMRYLKGTKYIIVGSGRGIQLISTDSNTIKNTTTCVCDGSIINYTFSTSDTHYKFYVIHSNGIDIFSSDLSSSPIEITKLKSISLKMNLISLTCNKTLKLVNDNDKTLEFIEISDYDNVESIKSTFVKTAEENGSENDESTDDITEDEQVIEKEEEEDLKAKKMKISEKTHILGAKDSAIPSSNVIETKKDRKSSISLEDVELGKRIEEFTKSTEEYKEKKVSSKLDIPKDLKNDASSIYTILCQALQTNDKTMLTFCLNQRKPNIIYHTVTKLSNDESLKLLDVCISKFEKKPRSGYSTFLWIKAVLSIHSDYFMGLKDMNEKLKFLRKLLDDRSRANLKLCELLGRLDFLESQMKLLKDEVSVEYESINKYKETAGDDDDDDDDEGSEVEDGEEDDEEGNMEGDFSDDLEEDD